ncbi:MAG: hypothetical protein AAGI90_01325 [Chlamydiota bacterium]
MVHLTSLRKNKIHLQDYPYKEDIQNRLLLSHLTVTEVELLEEILFSRLEIPIAKLKKQFPALSYEDLLENLNKLTPLGLYTLRENRVYVDKEKRKYYESQLVKFDEDFKPDMDCLSHLLKKVPIHVLPTWYSISKSSNNIFASILDKFLTTPQIYQRYCSELGYPDPVFLNIITDLFQAKHFELYASDLKKKYNLTDEAFHEYVLHFEFNFICVLGYKRIGDVWEEILTPLYEWKQFLLYQQKARPVPINNIARIDRLRSSPFAFVEDMTVLLKKAAEKPIPATPSSVQKVLGLPNTEEAQGYTKELMEKLEEVRFTSLDTHVELRPLAKEFLLLDKEQQSLYLYRHIHHQSSEEQPRLLHERHQREIERSLKSFAGSDWIYFEDFVQSSMIALRDQQKIFLKQKSPKSWSYCFPEYSSEDKSIIFNYMRLLFHCSMVEIGKMHGQDCFSLTEFGRKLLI